jgi:5-methylcytosine-specific restriction protein A
VHERARKVGVDARRGTAKQRGYDSRWAKASAGYLRSHPLCVVCEQVGRVTPSRVTDHIVPHKGSTLLFWNASNWRALCKRCHDRATVLHDGGFGRPVNPKAVADAF